MDRLSLKPLKAAALMATAAALVVAAGALAANGPAGDGPSLAQIRAATARFHDVNEALAEGYVPASACVEMPGVGGMGYHYVNRRLTGDPAIDPLQPELLLYAPTEDGGLNLVGVEYWRIALARTDAGPAPWFGAAAPPNGFVTTAPSLLGRPFDGPMAGHDPAMPWHYDRHVWIWLNNDAGMFAQFNAKVTC